MIENLIAKYLLAAHLALLAVAPLVLFQFLAPHDVATVLLWLSFFGLIWIFMEPSTIGNEYAHVARSRTKRSLFGDPMTYLLLVVIAIALVRCFNDVIELKYVPDASNWELSLPKFQFLPASANGCGYLPFATAVAASVVTLGLIHALNRSARLFFMSSTAFIAAVMACVFLMMNVTIAGDYHLGPVFAVVGLGSLVAIADCLATGWFGFLPSLLIAFGLVSFGAIYYSTHFETLAFIISAFVTLIISIVYLRQNRRHAAELKFIGFCLASLVVGWFVFHTIMPECELRIRLMVMFNEVTDIISRNESQSMLYSLAYRSWKNSLWCGCGLGAFGLFARFSAGPEFWQSFPTGVESIPNGMLHVLAERGLIGAVMLFLPAVFMIVTWGRRLFVSISTKNFPTPTELLLPILFAYVVAISFFSCSLLRADVLIMVGAIASMSVTSFRLKGNEDG